MKLYEKLKPEPTWPTYDEMHATAIPELAEQLGLGEPALLYEQRTKNRASVVAKLQELAERKEAEEALTAAS